MNERQAKAGRELSLEPPGLNAGALLPSERATYLSGRWYDESDGCCGAYGGTHQRGEPNAFCDCGCHESTS